VTSWTEQAKLSAHDGAAGDQLGISMEISGDTVSVGATGDDNSEEMFVFIHALVLLGQSKPN